MISDKLKSSVLVIKQDKSCIISLIYSLRKELNIMIFVTDSCSDLTEQQVKEMDLKIIPLTVEIDGTSYAHYPDERELSIKKFYGLLRDKQVAKTSLINVGTFIEFFEHLLQSKEDILYLSFSSALSGTYQSAVLASNELKAKYPDQKIICVDSKSASMGQGLLAYLTHKKIQEGLEITEVAKWIEMTRLQVIHLFTVDDLGTLKRGGRLSDTQAFLGSLLKIKPILHVSDEGKLVPLKKARGREFSLQTMIALVGSYIQNPKDQVIFISHGDCLEEALFVGNQIKETYQVKEIIYNHIGPIIGAHSGPGTIAIFFIGEKR